MPPFLFLIGLLMLASSAQALPQGKAFELYPVTNGAAPTTYTKAAPAFVLKGKPWKFAPGSTVKIKINAAQVWNTVTPYQFGNNVNWWSKKDWFLDPDRIEKAKQSGIKFWRWPGGSS